MTKTYRIRTTPGDDKNIRIWDLNTGKCIKKFDIASSVRGTSQLGGAIPLYCQVPKVQDYL